MIPMPEWEMRYSYVERYCGNDTEHSRHGWLEHIRYYDQHYYRYCPGFSGFDASGIRLHDD